MATEQKASHTPVTPAGGSNDFVHRELNGATFLTLEHIAHMALVVVVSGLLLAAISAALSMWAGLPGITGMMTMGLSTLMGSGTKVFEAIIAIGIVAALLVLTPALVVLDRRTRAEWHKRPGYANRLAYKVPVYTALAILVISTVLSVIEMLYIVLASLVYIGVANAPISSMYVDSFIPALIAFVVFAAAAWYVFKLAKGVDYGKKFSLGVAALSGAAVISLFITALVVFHNGDNSFTSPSSNMGPTTTSPYDNKYYQDLLNQLQQ